MLLSPLAEIIVAPYYLRVSVSALINSTWTKMQQQESLVETEDMTTAPLSYRTGFQSHFPLILKNYY